MNAIVPETSLAPSAALARPLVRIVIVGHVDHGKSTLIGRLLHETGSLPEGKLETLQAVSARRGMPFEWSFLLDALQTERDQGITIDTSQIRFRTRARDFVLIDAPGHTEFLRNMITGAAQADVAILIVDATEGVREQTRRHGYLLHLLGVRQVAVVINKMDRVNFDATRFREIETELSAYLAGLGVTATAAIPISARNGDGVARRTPAIDWHRGPTVLEALDRFVPAQAVPDLALRLPVQAVYKFDDRRIVAGRIESGRLAIGDELLIQPSGKSARIKTIEVWPGDGKEPRPQEAFAGQSVGITLDQELFVERGNVLARTEAPANVGRFISARIFWLHHTPLDVGARLIVRVGTAQVRGIIKAIKNAVDPGRLTAIGSASIGQNHVGEVDIELTAPIAADIHTRNPVSGRIVLDFDTRIAGGGLILSIDAESEAHTDTRAAPVSSSAPTSLAEEAGRLTRLLADLPPGQRLAQFRGAIAGRVVFTTSFGLEDQVLFHVLAAQNLDIDVATLDTGRLFPETYDLWAETERRYGARIKAFYPRHAELEELVAQQGINGFYASPAARLTCCHVRKVEPLNRALAGARGWVTGLRGDQSAHRQSAGLVDADTERGLLKLNPLIDWSRDDVLGFAREHAVPINPLHAKGFASIGCAPCTRALAPGEPERAGRWWWEQEDKKECGLHLPR